MFGFYEMNFLLFLLSLFLFYVIYEHLVLLVTALPGVGALYWFRWLTQEKIPPVRKIGQIIGLILVHLASMGLNTFIIGISIALITVSFAQKSGFPWLYFIIGGIAGLATVPHRSHVSISETLVFYILGILKVYSENEFTFMVYSIILWTIAIAVIVASVLGFKTWLQMKSKTGKGLRCPFCHRKLTYSGLLTKPYDCKCGAYGEWVIEGKTVKITRGDVSYNLTI